MIQDETLQRVLPILYADWFCYYPNLYPLYFWLVELDSREPGEFLSLTKYPRHIYFLDHIGIYEKHSLDWLRFYQMHLEPIWYQGADYAPPSSIPETIRKGIYDVGFGYFWKDSENNIEIVLSFGKLYGRGYMLHANNKLEELWRS